MPFTLRLGARLACALSLLVSMTPPDPAEAGEPRDLLAWRNAATTTDLVQHLETWLDAETSMPRRAEMPAIRLIGGAQARNLAAGRASRHGGRARGFYDAESQTIYLVRPWDPRNPYDVSVLLHELAHHRQAEFGHWYCPGAQELPAYRLQEAWLGELGLTPDVNWIAVVLEAGCARHDIHPD